MCQITFLSREVVCISTVLIWPWGWEEIESPNDSGLQTIGRKLAFFNGYGLGSGRPGFLYEVNGATTEYAYGKLCTAAVTFELGTAFHQSCNYFESNIVPGNIPALNYALKIASYPFSTPKGIIICFAVSLMFCAFHHRTLTYLFHTCVPRP